MIQANGIIVDPNGITQYENPLINVFLNSKSKFQPTLGVAQVGKIKGEEKNETFEIIASIGTYEYTLKNPSFNDVQEIVLKGLQLDFPNVEFSIIK